MGIDVHILPIRDIPDLLLSCLSLPSLSVITTSTSMLLDKILAHYFLWLRHILVGIWNSLLFHPSSLELVGASLSAECKSCCSKRCRACVVPRSRLSPRRDLEWKGLVVWHLTFQLFKQSLHYPVSWLFTPTQSPRRVAALPVSRPSHVFTPCILQCRVCLFVLFFFNFLLYCGEEPISIDARAEKLA